MSNAELMCRIDVKYQYTIQAVCAYAHVFLKQLGCALIGACALTRRNMISHFFLIRMEGPGIDPIEFKIRT